MKNDKFCFNKGTSLIVLIGIVLVGFVLASRILIETTTTTDSRASGQAQTKELCGYNRSCIYQPIISTYPNYNERDTIEEKVCIKNGTPTCTSENRLVRIIDPNCPPLLVAGTPTEETPKDKEKRCTTYKSVRRNINFILEVNGTGFSQKYETYNQVAVFNVDEFMNTEKNQITVGKISQNIPYSLNVRMGTNLYGYRKVSMIIDCDALENEKYKVRGYNGSYWFDPAISGQSRDIFKSINTTTKWLFRQTATFDERGIPTILEPKDTNSQIAWMSDVLSSPLICKYTSLGKHLIYAYVSVTTAEYGNTNKQYEMYIPMYINLLQ